MKGGVGGAGGGAGRCRRGGGWRRRRGGGGGLLQSKVRARERGRGRAGSRDAGWAAGQAGQGRVGVVWCCKAQGP